MDDSQHWHYSIIYFVKKVSDLRLNANNGYNFIKKLFLLNPVGECASWRKSTNRCNLYEMPLIDNGISFNSIQGFF